MADHGREGVSGKISERKQFLSRLGLLTTSDKKRRQEKGKKTKEVIAFWSLSPGAM